MQPFGCMSSAKFLTFLCSTFRIQRSIFLPPPLTRCWMFDVGCWMFGFPFCILHSTFCLQMEPTANAMAAPAAAARAQPPSHRAPDSDFWSSLLMAFALSSIAVGVIWDISWHESIGRDTFWTPAHGAIYLGGALAGCVAGWLAIQHTFLARERLRDSSVSVFGARAPLGAWVALWGAIAMLTAGPFDNWWHNAYGLDVKIISPPHVVLGLGMLGISVGVLLLVLSRQNSFPDSSTKGSGLFIYTGGVFVVLGSVFLLEYIYPNDQHGGM